MRHASTTLALAALFTLVAAGDAPAQRGGRAGGARPGGAGRAGLGGFGGGGPGVANRGPSPGARPGFNPAPRPGGINRPGAGNLPGGINRPGAGNLPGIMDRPALAAGNRANVVNRPSIVNRPNNINTNIQQNARNTVVNRPTNIQQNVRNTQNVQNTVVNRPQVNSNNRNVNVTNVTQNIVNNNRTNVVNNRANVIHRPGSGNWGRPGFGYGAFPGYGAGFRPAVPGVRPYYQGSYAGYHRGWYNGYWSGHYSNRPAWNWGSFAAGSALGGLLGWGYGSSVYQWGYSRYANPYYVAAPITVAVTQPIVVQGQPTPVAYQAQAFDYSRPLDVDAPAPAASVADPAVRDFDSARASFKAGDYVGALRLTDQALTRMPNDPALHEFRGLVLFALKQYDAAAAAIYTVLSVSPGWNWTTLAGLYPGVDVYTGQLRALEGFRNQYPDSASAHFLLAYHYLTAGNDDVAARELREVVRIKPSDSLSAAMLRQLTPDPAQASAATAAPAATTGGPSAPVAATAAAANTGMALAALIGSWKAAPAPGTSIGLAIRGDGRFTWDVDEGGHSQKFDGTVSSDNGILTLARDDAAGALVGKVARQGDDRFVFKLLGGPADDPGLDFRK